MAVATIINEAYQVHEQLPSPTRLICEECVDIECDLLYEEIFKEKGKKVILPQWDFPFIVESKATFEPANTNINMRDVDANFMLFNELLSSWYEERESTSSVMEMVICPSYQRIIAMGEERAVPLILRQLEKEAEEPDHWFWALRVLTNADPVSQSHQGDVVAMAADWLEWGLLQGYVW